MKGLNPNEILKYILLVSFSWGHFGQSQSTVSGGSGSSIGRSISGESPTKLVKLHLDRARTACECMDYWACAIRNGQVYSYCGISDDEVCCFMQNTTTTTTITTSVPSSSDYATPAEDAYSTTTRTNFLTSEEFKTASTLGVGQTTGQTTGQGQGVEDEGTTSIPIKIKGVIAKATDQRDEGSAPPSCGVPTIPTKLDGQAEFREWPWHVAILEVTEDLYICGGALISPQRVITAAHCVSSYTNSIPRLKVRAGEFDVSGNHETDPHVEVIINLIAVHPQFDNGTLANDIAVVGLSRPINFTRNIQPLCIPWRRFRSGRTSFENGTHSTSSRLNRNNTKCVATGWGRLSEDSNHSIILKEVPVPLWSSLDCENRLKKNFGSNYRLPTTAICAGDQGAHAAICDGDGGGPLACYHNGKWYHEGIVSFGIGCGRPDSPGVYTRISSYLPWIRGFLN